MREIMPLRNGSWPRQCNKSMPWAGAAASRRHLQGCLSGAPTPPRTHGSGHRVSSSVCAPIPAISITGRPGVGLRPDRPDVAAAASQSAAHQQSGGSTAPSPRPQSCLRLVKRCRPRHEALLAPRSNCIKRFGAASSIERARTTMSAASWSALLLHGRHLAYTVLTLGVGVHAVGIHLLATVLPSVVADLGGAAFYTWATMLTIASIMGTACGGLLKAMLNLRRGYMVGVLVELAGWAGCAVAPHIAVLLLARAIQGFGSGLLVALAYSMVSEFYAETMRARCYRPSRAYGGSGAWPHCGRYSPPAGGGVGRSGWRYRSSSCWEAWPGKPCKPCCQKCGGRVPNSGSGAAGGLGYWGWRRAGLSPGGVALGFAGQRCD